MKRISIVVFVLVALPVVPAWAVNKCVSQDGSISYQTAPCPAGANATEIQGLPKNGPSSNPGEVTRIKNFVKKSEIEREITQSQDLIANYQQEMNAKMEALRIKKHAANNNLAGATWEQSISGEMNAISQQYDALIRSEQDRIVRLRDEAKSLQEEK